MLLVPEPRLDLPNGWSRTGCPRWALPAGTLREERHALIGRITRSSSVAVHGGDARRATPTCASPWATRGGARRASAPCLHEGAHDLHAQRVVDLQQAHDGVGVVVVLDVVDHVELADGQQARARVVAHAELRLVQPAELRERTSEMEWLPAEHRQSAPPAFQATCPPAFPTPGSPVMLAARLCEAASIESGRLQYTDRRLARGDRAATCTAPPRHGNAGLTD